MHAKDMRCDVCILQWLHYTHRIHVLFCSTEDVKDGDIIQSIYQLFTIVHEQIVALQCMLLNVKKAYFCGNFIENEVARTNIMMYHITRDLMVPAVCYVYITSGGGGQHAHLPQDRPINLHVQHLSTTQVSE